MTTAILEIMIILGLILANGLFAMAELALISARKNRLEQAAANGDPRAFAALELSANPNRLLSTVQIGITLIGIISGALGGATLTRQFSQWLDGLAWLAPYSDFIAFLAVVILITYFSLVLGELIPKRLALNNPENAAIILAKPMKFLGRLFSPLIRFLSASTNLGLRLMHIRPNPQPAVTEQDVYTMLEQGTQSGVFEETEEDMVKSVFRLSDRKIASLMTPRTEITWIDLDEPLEAQLAEVLQSGHNRYPAARGSLDALEGILSIHDLLAFNLSRNNHTPLQIADLRGLLKPPIYTPENAFSLRVLGEMKRTGKHLAIIIDEYGGVTGMVTLMDLLGAVISEIPGSGSFDQPQIIQRPDGSWLVDGLLNIEDFKRSFEIKDLPREERAGFQTLGGFIVTHLGSIPTSGQSFTWDQYTFEILDMDGHRVDKVLLSHKPPSPQKGSSPTTP